MARDSRISSQSSKERDFHAKYKIKWINASPYVVLFFALLYSPEGPKLKSYSKKKIF